MVDVQTIGVLVTAASVSVAAIYYMFTLRINMKNQELNLKSQQQADETRQAQLFMQVFSRYHEEEFWKAYQIVMSREWKSYDDWNKDRSDPDLFSTRTSVNTYLNGIGVLVKRGLLSLDLVADILGGPIVMLWNKEAEYIREFRVKTNYGLYLKDLEYLFEEIMRLRSAGFAPKVDYSLASSIHNS
jgi:hypothetical protein